MEPPIPLQSNCEYLEAALAEYVRDERPMPSAICGRLAAVYRALERFDDEVMLLEQYRESQVDDIARARFEARLGKARTLAERMRRRESGAISSVRDILARPNPYRRIRSNRAPPATRDATLNAP